MTREEGLGRPNADQYQLKRVSMARCNDHRNLIGLRFEQNIDDQHYQGHE